MPAFSRRKRSRSPHSVGWSHQEIHTRRWRSSIGLLALDQLRTGIVVTDRTGQIIEMNRAAEAIVQIEDGLLIREGRFCARRVFEAAKLAKLIAGAAAGRMLIGRCDGLPPCVLTVMPLPIDLTIDDRRFAMIIVVDPARYAPSETDLTGLFGLSPAEARVASALATGKSLSMIADTYGVQITTVRTQVRSILRKVGVKRQFDLVRILSGTGIGSISFSVWWFDTALAAAQISWSFAA